MFDLQRIVGAGLEEAVRQMPAAVVIVAAPSGEIILANEEAEGMMGQNLGLSVPSMLEDFADLRDGGHFEIYRPDGRAYEPEEWPLARSIRTGEEVRDEEYYCVLADGTRSTMRCDSSPIYDEGRIVASVAIYKDITGQKRADEQLAYYARLQENTYDAFIATDERLVVKAWNRGAERMYGLTAGEAVGLDAREATSLEMSDEQVTESFREVAEKGQLRVEQIQHRKDGTPIHVDSLTIAMRDERGETTGYLSVNRDVTERRWAEEEQQRLADIVQNSSEFIGIADLDWRATFLNEAGRRMVGLGSMEEVLRTRVPDYFMAEDKDFLLREVVPELESGGRWAGELRLRHFVTGEPIPVLWDGFRVDDPETGEPFGFATVTRDITERKKAEEEREARSRQQAVVADLGLRALANQGFDSLLEDIVGLVSRTLDVEFCKVVELLPGGDELLLRAGIGWREGTVGSTAEMDPQVAHTLRSSEPVIFEDLETEVRFEPAPVLREHGAKSGMTVLVPGRDGPFGALGAHTVTRRAFSEDDANFLQAVANVLATAIEREKAEGELDEVREVERRRMARDLHDEALQALAYAMTQAQLVRAAPGADETAQRSDRLVEALKRVERELRGAIYDLRLESERDKPFSELLRSLVELRRSMAPECEITLNLHDGSLEGPLGTVGREVLRIIGEALTNVRRHSGARNVRVSVSTSAGRLVAEVSDDGRGTDLSRRPSTSGGMGIKSMRERARSLGGELEIESGHAMGTKVRFEMPPERERQEPGSEVRVLLVEDHAAVREAIAASFEREAGFEVVGQAGSLAEARRVIEERPVDVAVVDLGLPDGYGGDLIGALRAANPRAQALVLSATLGRAEAARAVQSGAAGVLNKTAHLDEVVGSVERLRAGETLMPLEEVVELLRFADTRRDQEYQARHALESLTPRETEVLRTLAEGFDSEGSARKLHISVRTQCNHVASILAKLGVHSQLQALVFAVRHGAVKIS